MMDHWPCVGVRDQSSIFGGARAAASRLSSAERCVRDIANPAPIFKISSKTGLGMDTWLDWVRHEAGSRG